MGCLPSLTPVYRAGAYHAPTGMSVSGSHSSPPMWSLSVWVMNTASSSVTPMYSSAESTLPRTWGLPVSMRAAQSSTFRISASPLPTVAAKSCTDSPPG